MNVHKILKIEKYKIINFEIDLLLVDIIVEKHTVNNNEIYNIVDIEVASNIIKNLNMSETLNLHIKTILNENDNMKMISSIIKNFEISKT